VLGGWTISAASGFAATRQRDAGSLPEPVDRSIVSGVRFSASEGLDEPGENAMSGGHRLASFLFAIVSATSLACGDGDSMWNSEDPDAAGGALLFEHVDLFEADLSTFSSRAPQPNPARNVYFGDLHVHTTYSFDAFAFGTVATPDDAYRYAQGERIRHPGGFDVQLRQPLDFYAVTDHALFLGAA
jgi:hypothetical protein